MTEALTEFMEQHPRLIVLTGAGISAASGIPTYRDSQGTWQRSTPIQHQDFVSSQAARQRYWARSMLGWPLMAGAQPNAAHECLAALEYEDRISLLITQNVDGLHQRAGQRRVIDLHGNLSRVLCLSCERVYPRALIQEWLEARNEEVSRAVAAIRPDGDAEVSDELIADIEVPECPHCGGILKPDVVFFGGAVPRERVAHVMRAVEKADALLVLGSSLMVFSGFRFCRRAHELGIPVAAVNQGVTRADHLLSLKVERDCGEVLQELRSALCAGTLRDRDLRSSSMGP